MKYSDVIHNKYVGPAAILSYKDGRVSMADINEGFLPEHWMDLSLDEFVDRDPYRCFDEDNLKILVNAVKKCIETGEEQRFETWRTVISGCCNSDRICIRSRIVLLEKGEDESFIFESVLNVTNEKRTELTLEDIEYRYKQASEQINIYNWEYDVATKQMRPCYRCMRDLGLPAVVDNYPEPAIDMGIFPPDYADMYREMMRKIHEGAKTLEADIPLTVGRIPFRVKYTTEFDESGKPVKAFGSATLISEKEIGHIKLDNQIIATLSREYSCIYVVDFISDELKVIKQEDCFLLKEDDGPKALFEEVASKFPGADKERLMLLVDRESIRHEIFAESERREFLYKNDDLNRWVRIDYHVIERRGGPIESEAMTVDRMLVTVMPVDDLVARRLDDERLIASQNKELEERQKKLIAAIEEVHKANRAKTVFFSNMSHDIRTPMNAITGFSRLALEELDNREHLKDYLEKIVTAGDHLLNLINNILDMGRIESGRMELSLSTACVSDILTGCADMVRANMADGGLEFSVDVDDMGKDIVECDKLRLRQIVLNLLSNANKFTPEGGRVSLKGEKLSYKESITYRISVKDNGIGMSEEFAKNIFNAYTREKSEIVRETQGTGLGMAIVKNIVDLMEGSIEVKTAPGKGTEFVIDLSMKPAEEKQEVKEPDTGLNEALTKRYDGRTVLVVDDIAVNLKLAECILVKFGFRVITALSGEEAVKIVKASKDHGAIDVILMDVLMPEMDGLEATRRIRALKDPGLSGIPIIAMTANAFASDIQETHKAGMNAHVSKPFLKEELITRINENLK